MEKTEVNSPFLSADDWLGRHSERVGQRRTRRLKYEFDDRMGNSKKSRLTLGQFNYYWSLNKLISLPSDSRYRRLTIKGGQFSISPLALLCFIRQRQIAHWKCIAVCTNDNNKHVPFCEMRLLSAQSLSFCLHQFVHVLQEQITFTMKWMAMSSQYAHKKKMHSCFGPLLLVFAAACHSAIQVSRCRSLSPISMQPIMHPHAPIISAR